MVRLSVVGPRRARRAWGAARWLAPCAGRAGGLACRWQPGRAGTETGELTANPEGGRRDTLGAGAGPASGRIRSPAIVPAGIATPNARDRHLLWARRYQDRCPTSELTQPAGGQAGLAGCRRVAARLLQDPVSEFENLRDRMGRLYDQTAPQRPGQSPVEPDIEVDETEEFYLVKAELPGITRDNVELQVDEHSLSITGSVREEQGEHLMHRRAGRFFYRTVLPRDIDTDKVQATMKEGILTIRLPKTKQATRRVQIRA